MSESYVKVSKETLIQCKERFLRLQKEGERVKLYLSTKEVVHKRRFWKDKKSTVLKDLYDLDSWNPRWMLARDLKLITEYQANCWSLVNRFYDFLDFSKYGEEDIYLCTTDYTRLKFIMEIERGEEDNHPL